MAGVGFELKKLFARQGLLAGLRAYGYSGAICAGPMLLGVLMQLGLQMLCILFGRAEAERDLLVCMVTYALLASLVTTSTLSMVVTRFLADMLFEERTDAVMPSFWGSTGLLLTVGGAVYGVFLLFSGAGALPGFLCWMLFGELVAVWNAMSYLTAIKDYRAVLRGFAAAAAAALALGALALRLGLPTVPAMLGAMCGGYGIMLAGQVSLLDRCFPAQKERPVSAFLFLKWCDEFRPLALTGLCTALGLFAHLVLMWLGPLQVHVQGLFVGAPAYDVPALLSFLTILVTTVNFVVSVEVNFYPKYRSYYALFNDKGSAGDILQAGREMLAVLQSELWYTGLKQLFATGLAVSLGGVLLPMLPLGMTDRMLGYFRVLCVGYGLYAVGNTALLLLLYFTDYAGALRCAVLFAASASGFTLLSMPGDQAYYGFGFLAGSALFFLAAVLRLDWFTRRLPYFILSRQPITAGKTSGPFTRLGRRLHELWEEDASWEGT